MRGFYLPLGAEAAVSQTLFTDTEVSLSWTMLFRPDDQGISTV